ncbi:alpha-ketoglutarate-dependent dioxygenase AlkB [Planktomarina sp.]|uniref:alpha-ketoglutarate-dependent dioxygenase AlkB family protein n=1 Tax=Planktomarina sp. TaxID=2024851 RepID=UPI00288FF7D3|nr:alpha-ketoglutarate-dependent dioxygenase AlkB [Planktomarina sp.]MDT2031902.1 alpha-ketoglutarate-dependent dioxygenase AlkB [Planktomarina sp.]
MSVFKEFLPPRDQLRLVEELREVAAKAPIFSPKTKSGKPMSVRLTAAGHFGWFSDQRGYRYEKQHPSGVNWPEIPESIMTIWRAVAGAVPDPECCLINFYGEGARMGLHQDRDEANFDWPVVSISLGDDALFRVGGTERGGKTESIWLQSGDVAVMGGPARLNYHGIDRIKFGSSSLLKEGGRLNVTLRVVR